MPPLRVGTFLAPRFRDLYREAVAGSLGEEATLVEDATFDDLLEGRLHAAFLCGLPYVWLRERAGVALAPLVAPVITGERYGGRPRYFSDLVVRAGDGAGGLEDLAGRRVAFNERASQSGFGVLVSALERRGLGPGHFGATIETGAHAGSLEAVRRGDADAAAIDSHLLDRLRLDDPTIDRDLTVVESLGPSPIQPLVAGPALGHADRERLRSGLSRRGAGSPRHLVDRWVPVGDSDYDPIRRTAAEVRERGGL